MNVVNGEDEKQSHLTRDGKIMIEIDRSSGTKTVYHGDYISYPDIAYRIAELIAPWLVNIIEKKT